MKFLYKIKSNYPEMEIRSNYPEMERMESAAPFVRAKLDRTSGFPDSSSRIPGHNVRFLCIIIYKL